MNVEMIKAITDLIFVIVIIGTCVYTIYSVHKLYESFGSTVDEHSKKIEDIEKLLNKKYR